MSLSVNILDPELPLLASQAAVELDAVLTGQQTDKAAVTQLAQRLQATLPDATGNQEPTRGLLADTETVTVLGQAVNLADKTQQTRTIEELSHRTKEIADQLANAAVGGSVGGLEAAKAFCLALSRCAATFRKTVYDLRPPHPFRR